MSTVEKSDTLFIFILQLYFDQVVLYNITILEITSIILQKILNTPNSDGHVTISLDWDVLKCIDHATCRESFINDGE